MPRRLRTHCQYGHEFTPENTLIASDGKRRCRTCHRRAEVDYKARRKARLEEERRVYGLVR